MACAPHPSRCLPCLVSHRHLRPISSSAPPLGLGQTPVRSHCRTFAGAGPWCPSSALLTHGPSLPTTHPLIRAVPIDGAWQHPPLLLSPLPALRGPPSTPSLVDVCVPLCTPVTRQLQTLTVPPFLCGAPSTQPWDSPELHKGWLEDKYYYLHQPTLFSPLLPVPHPQTCALAVHDLWWFSEGWASPWPRALGAERG